MRGRLVVAGAEAHGRFSGEFDRTIGSPVLPTGTGAYHTLAGLNLEGAPELPKPVENDSLVDHRPMSARPSMGMGENNTNIVHNSSSGGSGLPKSSRLSFASFAALRNLVAGGGGGGGAGITPRGENSLEPVAEHTDIQRPISLDHYLGSGGGRAGHGGTSGSWSMSRSESALDLHAGSIGKSNGTGSSAVPQVQIVASAGAGPDYSWYLSQHYAVAHGFDDLGLSEEVAPLWKKGTNILGTFADLEKRAAREQAAAMERMSLPMGPVERREAERYVAEQLRPVVVVPLPRES